MNVLLLCTAFVCLLALALSGRVAEEKSARKSSQEMSMRELHEQRLQKAREQSNGHRDRNSKGHRILERHDNGTVSLEIDEEGVIPRRRLADADAINSTYTKSGDVLLTYDPPNGAMSPQALGVYVYCTDEDARIYYETDYASNVTTNSAYATRSAPYIHLDTPFGATRSRTLEIVCLSKVGDEYFRSEQYTLDYIVEASARPGAFGFLVPGIETDSYFLKFVIEQKAAARAQVAGGQEFSDFYTELGVGTYEGQIMNMRLLDLMDELTGFEGGYSVNCTDGKQYGILVPQHNGEKFTGVVVRVDLEAMDLAGTCIDNWRHEESDGAGGVIVSGNSSAWTAANPCVHTLDLTTLHENARGFRKGFANMPYGFLSPGEFNVAVRLDVCDFGITTTKILDLGTVRNDTLGGYSGGFTDGAWACFNPFRTFVGPFGGVRSADPVDNGHLRPYYHAEVLCIYEDGWTSTTASDLDDNIRTFDLSLINAGLRGFSEAIRVGRFAYLAPLSSRPNVYSYQLVRIYLGTTDIGEMLDYIDSTPDFKLRDIVDVLDLRQVNTELAGFSSIFNQGKYLFLVPYRSENTRASGQRGHGKTVRVDMNIFDVGGTDVMDLTLVTRNQIPSFPDEDLRGFSSGFASGKYCIFVPFYNAIFSGKMARFIGIDDDMTKDLQVLNLVVDRDYPATFIGYRSGFVSLWQGAFDET